MILDEPTAHLDPESRRALTADILTVTQGRATLLITHDLDGLDQVDEIIVLDHRRVVERGTHAELLRSGGLYRRMVQSPAGVMRRGADHDLMENEQAGGMTCRTVSTRW
jgi:ABC-type multidrug transport system fused ATPase/permease subunit